MPTISLPDAAWIVDSVPFPVVRVDAKRVVTYCNRAAGAILGCSWTEAAGRCVEALPTGRELCDAVSQALATGESFSGRISFTSPADAAVVRHYRIWLEPERNERGGVKGVLLTGEDIANWQEAETERQRLARFNSLLEATHNIDLLIHSALDFDEIMLKVVAEAARAVGAESAVIYIWNEHTWRASYTFGRLDAVRGRVFTDEELRDGSLALHENRAFVINDAPNNSDVNRDLVEHHGVRAVLDAPLRMAEQPIGDFSLYYHSPEKHFTEAEREFMQGIGASVGVALQNASRFAKLQAAEAELRDRTRRAESELETIYEEAPIGLIVFDRELRYMRINKRMAEINGATVAAHLGRTLREVLPQFADVAERIAQQIFTTGKPVFNVEVHGQTRAQPGVERYVLLNWLPLKDAHGSIWGINVAAEEITERRQTEMALRESEARFRALADNISQLAWMADSSGARFWFNRRWFDITGTSAEKMEGWGWQAVHHPEHMRNALERYRRGIDARVPFENIVPLRTGDGSYRWFMMRAVPIRDKGGRVVLWFGTDTDITEQRQLEEQARQMALHDPLTGLANRRLLFELMNGEMQKAVRSNKKVGLLFLDLDRFKIINDTLGHEVGDELLKQVAKRISGRIRRSDTLARLGGDEFTVLLTDLTAGDYAREAAEDLVRTFDEPFRLAQEQVLYVTTSIGISLYPDDDSSAEGLLRRADLAMYEAKEQGRNTYRFYNPVLDHRSKERAYIGNHLRESLENGGLSILYQPQIDLRTGAAVGVEALLRWNHPRLGLLAPGQFIAIAEETDLIILLDKWVFRSVCAQARRWLDEGRAPVSIGVNVSAKWFESRDVVEDVRQNVEEQNLPTDMIELELTESTVMRHIDQTVGRMRELAAMGVHIAIDDFGTGYSSLSYLKRLPIRTLKIDLSFIRDIGTDADDRAIITAVTALAHTMNKRVVAEGVETEEQAGFLNSAGCDEAQGYLYAQPLTPERFRNSFLR